MRRAHRQSLNFLWLSAYGDSLFQYDFIIIRYASVSRCESARVPRDISIAFIPSIPSFLSSSRQNQDCLSYDFSLLEYSVLIYDWHSYIPQWAIIVQWETFYAMIYRFIRDPSTKDWRLNEIICQVGTSKARSSIRLLDDSVAFVEVASRSKNYHRPSRHSYRNKVIYATGCRDTVCRLTHRFTSHQSFATLLASASVVISTISLAFVSRKRNCGSSHARAKKRRQTRRRCCLLLFLLLLRGRLL